MRITILLYEDMTALDVIGPYEVLSRLPDADVRFTAARKGLVRSDMKCLGLSADYATDEIDATDVFLVGGGPGDEGVRADSRTLAWIRRMHETSTWTASVCTGSLILAAAGVLEGKRATSHFAALDELASYGVEVSTERVVVDGKVITGAGVSAGIDMALTLTAQIAGEEYAQTLQLGIEYDPQPPFDTGSPARAPSQMVDLVKTLLAS
jgi:putative intracellular protease/amidase